MPFALLDTVAQPSKGNKFGTRGQARVILAKAMQRPGELDLLERLRAVSRARNPAVRVGIGDDCAVLRVPAGCELVVTTDLLLEGRHFRRDWHSAASAGHRCLARGLSDIAAMGAQPLAAFLSLGLPTDFDPSWLDGFMNGFNDLAQRFQVELAGGDTAQTTGAHIVADIVVTGAVPVGRALLRSTARAGDGLYVSGELGGSAVELAQMAAGLAADGTAAGRQSFPEPRIELGIELVRLGLATSCMDLSDGLSLDLARLCAASGCGAEVAAMLLPIAAGATLEQALHGGEDYELLFTVPAATQVPATLAGLPVRRIGTMLAQPAVLLQNNGGATSALAPDGFQHFARSA